MSTNATLFKNGFPNVVYPSQHVGKNGQSSKSKSSKGDAEKHRLVAENIVCNTHVGRALQKLARALQFSHDCDRPKWDFAVELLDLEQMGVSHDELRWLIGKGFVDHAREVFSKGGTGRAFDSLGGYTFTEHSCFVITESGSSWYNQSESWLNRAPCAATQMIERPQAEESGSTEVEKPFWDSQRHEL